VKKQKSLENEDFRVVRPKNAQIQLCRERDLLRTLFPGFGVKFAENSDQFLRMRDQ
jgi:hypothetical protein